MWPGRWGQKRRGGIAKTILQELFAQFSILHSKVSLGYAATNQSEIRCVYGVCTEAK
jgi:hypothetical protein